MTDLLYWLCQFIQAYLYPIVGIIGIVEVLLVTRFKNN